MKAKALSEIEDNIQAGKITTGSRYTLVEDNSAKEYVKNAVDNIRSIVIKALGTEPYRALILAGSYGRGEGGVIKASDGTWKLVNDIELYIIQDRPSGKEYSGLEKAIARQYHLYHADIKALNTSEIMFKDITMSSYDLRFGSQVLAGDENVYNLMGDFRHSDMPVSEAAKLLINRGAGILLFFSLNNIMRLKDLDDDIRQNIKNQIVKAGVAMGDCALVMRRAYNASYRKRMELFNEYERGNSPVYDEAAVAFIVTCYREKLYPGFAFNDLKASYKEAAEIYGRVLLYIMSGYFGYNFDSLDEYIRVITRGLKFRNILINSILWKYFRKALGLVMKKPQAFGKLRLQRKVIYACVPALLASAPWLDEPDPGFVDEAERFLPGHLKKDTAKMSEEVRWETLRGIYTDYWLSAGL